MDHTYETLVKYINVTQKIATKALRQFDSNAEFRIMDAPDLGIPYDVDRLAGGFPTGVYIQWECKEPIIPVDTTVNCCTASIFRLKENDKIDVQQFVTCLSSLNTIWKDGSYIMNFDRGNHFISLCMDSKERMYLIMHSGTKEFTKCYNGLYPIKGNWYYDKIKVFECNGRYFRYIRGREAEIFSKTAQSLNRYNEIRHENIAYSIFNKIGAEWISAEHYHHYGMDSDHTIKIGCYVVDKGTIFPVFSKPSYDIDLFEVEKSSQYTVDNKLVVPHGWGKKVKSSFAIKCDYARKELILGEDKFDILKNDTLYKCQNVEYRDYTENGKNCFYDCHREQVQGKVIEKLRQMVCLSVNGVQRYF